MQKVLTEKKKKVARRVSVVAGIPTIVHYIVDSSGSMSSCKAALISGFNEYVEDLKLQYREHPEKGEIQLGITKFNTVVQLRPPRPVESIYPMDAENYQPGGNTALYDAMGFSVLELDKIVVALPVKPNVILAIHTDGQENASRTWGLEQIRQMIAARQELGWTITFLGVDIDAYAAAGSIGIARGNTLNITGRDTDRAFNAYSIGTRSVRDSSHVTGEAFGSQNFYDAASPTLADDDDKNNQVP